MATFAKVCSGNEVPPTPFDHRYPSSADAGRRNKRVHDSSLTTPEEPSKRMRLFDEEPVHIAQSPPLQHPQPRSLTGQQAAFLPHNDHPPKADFVFAWLDSLSADCESRRTRSDSFLIRHKSEEDPVSRTQSQSTPIMSKQPVDNRFVVPSVPQTPSPSISIPPASSYGSQTSGYVSLVNTVSYRKKNLRGNRIFLRERFEQLPPFVAQVVNRITQRRSSPQPSVESVMANENLLRLDQPGVPESSIEFHFNTTIFTIPDPPGGLDTTARIPMAQRTVPPVYNRHNISTPAPDLLFGYDERGFPNHLEHLDALNNATYGTNSELMFPLFIVEYKSADGPMWVAVNQCLGGAAACTNLLEQFHQHLLASNCQGLQPEDRVSFSIAMNATEARIHVTWMVEEKTYLTQMIRGFLLQEPDQYILFRRYSKNIMDWGRTHRLEAIRTGLTHLKEAGALQMTPMPRRRGSSAAGNSSAGSSRAGALWQVRREVAKERDEDGA